MSVVLPNIYRHREKLEQRGVLCISEDEASRADIRPLRVGILNIMPKGETYEPYVLYPLSRSIIQIEPVWIRLHSHNYKSSDQNHLELFYDYFENAIVYAPLDGLLLTGAPVEEFAYEDVHYWDEITKILLFARQNITSTLGICWGGMALAKMLGIEKEMYQEKLFGAFETRNLDRSHFVSGELDDIFWCVQSRHSGISDKVLEEESARGSVNLLAHSENGGYTIFESVDHRYLMHLGHPEYEAQRLVEEYHRDVSLGRKDVSPPANIDLEKPINRWRSHGLEFFAQWVRYIFEPIKWGRK
ncbi:MAG: homoserine O-succinyltransferase [Bacteroidota bacterium]|jgi:homoserine O-succinyltransferase